jgi:N-acetylglucosamine-6-phosphate deacetylase
LAENPKLLAGSAQLLLWGLEHLARSGLRPLEDAWDMASLRPAALIGLPAASGLAHGAPADLVVYRWEAGKIRVVQTYKAGIARQASN